MNNNSRDISCAELVIPHFEEVQYFILDGSLPSLAFTPDSIEMADVIIPQDEGSVEFSTLSVNFIVDEDLKNYEKVASWILLKSPDYCDSEFPEDTFESFQDISMIFFGNSNKKVKEFKYIDAYPQDLGELQFSYNEDQAFKLTCSVTFAFRKVVML